MVICEMGVVCCYHDNVVYKSSEWLTWKCTMLVWSL